MIIVDTSIWIEFFRQSDETISEMLAGYLEDNEVVGLSVIFGELLQGAKSEAEERLILEFWRGLIKIDESELLIEAGKLAHKRKLPSKGIGLIDSCILQSVKSHKFSLWTLDKKLNKEYQIL